MVKKTPAQVREQAYRMALDDANEREREGDPEGAGVIRDLAKRIRRIRLTN